MATLRIIGLEPSSPGPQRLAGTTDVVEVAGQGRILNSGYLSFVERATDPGAVANDGHLYVKEVAGATQLFYRSDSGTVYQVTGVAAATVTLQSAYDGGNTISTNALGNSVSLSHTSGVGSTPLLNVSKTPIVGGNGDALSVTRGATGTGNAITISVQNNGRGISLTSQSTGTALFVNQTVAGPIVDFQDSGVSTFLINAAGAVTATPTTGQSFSATAVNAGQILLTGGSTGGTTITNATNAASTGSVLSLTAGATTAAAQNGGTANFRGGNATTGTGGQASIRGGSATTGVGGSSTILGGDATAGGGIGGTIDINPGLNTTATTNVSLAGNVNIGISANAITIGNSSWSAGGVPGDLSLIGGTTSQAATAGGAVVVTGGAGTTVGGGISLTTGAGATGGLLALTGGTGTSTGGSINVFGGSGTSGGGTTVRGGAGSTGGGGLVSIEGGASTSGTPGNVQVIGGLSGAGNDPSQAGDIEIGIVDTDGIYIGGNTFAVGGTPTAITIQGHNTDSGASGGDVIIAAGYTDGSNGGNISITSGADIGGGDAGSINIQSGASAGGSGGDISIRSASGTPGDRSTTGSITVGLTQTSSIIIGGTNFSAGGDPQAVEIRGHSSSQSNVTAGAVTLTGGSSTGVAPYTLGDGGGPINITGGSSTNYDGGSVLINGGASSSTTRSGGDIRLLAGNTGGASSGSGGSVVILAGSRGGSDASFTGKGSITIGNQRTNSIVIGGGSATASPVPASVQILGHSTATGATPVKAGDIEIEAGSATGDASNGGDVYIDGGASVDQDPGVVYLQSNGNGTSVIVGDGVQSSGLEIRNGNLIFSSVAATGIGNPAPTTFIGANSFIPKRLPKAWGKFFGQASVDDGVGLTSVAASGNGAIITFQHSAGGSFQNAYAGLCNGTTTTTACFLTANTYTVNSIIVQAWRWSGAAIVEESLASNDWSIIRMARLTS